MNATCLPLCKGQALGSWENRWVFSLVAEGMMYVS